MSSVPYDTFEIKIQNPMDCHFHVRCQSDGDYGALFMDVERKKAVIPLYKEYVFGSWLRWWHHVRESALLGQFPLGAPSDQWIRYCDAIVQQGGEYSARGSIRPNTTLTLTMRKHVTHKSSMCMDTGTILCIERTDAPINLSLCATSHDGNLSLELSDEAALPSGINLRFIRYEKST